MPYEQDEVVKGRTFIQIPGFPMLVSVAEEDDAVLFEAAVSESFRHLVMKASRSSISSRAAECSNPLWYIMSARDTGSQIVCETYP